MKRFKLALPWQIFIGIALGVLFGVFLSEYVCYIRWMGNLFMNALKMVVIPLVFSSIFIGVANMGGSKDFGRIATKTISYYIITTVIAAIIGLVLVNTIKPGVNTHITLQENITSLNTTGNSIEDMLVNIVPSNIFNSLSSGNLVSIIFFAILLGIFTSKIENKYQSSLIDLFTAFYQVMIKITTFVIKFTPFGVFAIIANMIATQVSDSAGLLNLAKSLGIYVLTVYCGFVIHGLGVLPLSVRMIGHENPWRFIKKMSSPLLTAFTTCSSNAALPLAIRDAQDKCGISEKIAGFTLPLGATVNMNGLAAFECVTALFVAQIYGIDLSLFQQITIIFTALLAAVGAAGIPMGGLVTMTIVFNVAGIPLEGIAIIMAVQQLCEMPRTFVNVFGDYCGALIIAKSEHETLTI